MSDNINTEPQPSISPSSSIQNVDVKYKKTQDKYLNHLSKYKYPKIFE